MIEPIEASIIQAQLQQTIESLNLVSEGEERMGLRSSTPLPSQVDLKEMMSLLKGVLFPGFFDKVKVSNRSRQYQIGIDTERIYLILREQISRGLLFCKDCDCMTEADMKEKGKELAVRFIKELPEIKRMLMTDVHAVAHNDPAVTSYSEVVFSYPAIQVMVHYRVAHALLKAGVPVIPRIITEMAHSATGIDIHPAAEIGEYFSIDHGTGIVIGETSVIGRHCMLYQGVTLGARRFKYDESGKPLNIPRHPVLEDNVTVYSNTSILGRVTIGHDTIIGGNIWLTDDVPPHSKVIQGKAIAPNE